MTLSSQTKCYSADGSLRSKVLSGGWILFLVDCTRLKNSYYPGISKQLSEQGSCCYYIVFIGCSGGHFFITSRVPCVARTGPLSCWLQGGCSFLKQNLDFLSIPEGLLGSGMPTTDLASRVPEENPSANGLTSKAGAAVDSGVGRKLESEQHGNGSGLQLVEENSTPAGAGVLALQSSRSPGRPLGLSDRRSGQEAVHGAGSRKLTADKPAERFPGPGEPRKGVVTTQRGPQGLSGGAGAGRSSLRGALLDQHSGEGKEGRVKIQAEGDLDADAGSTRNGSRQASLWPGSMGSGMTSSEQDVVDDKSAVVRLQGGSAPEPPSVKAARKDVEGGDWEKGVARLAPPEVAEATSVPGAGLVASLPGSSPDDGSGARGRGSELRGSEGGPAAPAGQAAPQARGGGEQHGLDARPAESAKTELHDIIDKLIALDPSGIFLEPVLDSFAPNYSKIIKKPMCFETIQAKATAGQYHSWLAFVEDFERICFNAMKYNQQRSKIWLAARQLLREGNAVLERYAERGDAVEGIVWAEGAARGESSDDLGEQRSRAAGSAGVGRPRKDFRGRYIRRGGRGGGRGAPPRPVAVPAPVRPGRPAVGAGLAEPPGPVPLEEASGEGEKEEGEEMQGLPMLDLDHAALEWSDDADGVLGGEGEGVGELALLEGSTRGRGAQWGGRGEKRASMTGRQQQAEVEARKRAQEAVEAVPVDIEGGDVGGQQVDWVRPDVVDSATESSSSFGDTASLTGGASEERGGGGAGASLEDVDSQALQGGGMGVGRGFAEMEGMEAGGARALPLNADWKGYRRGIEWRCRWLELQLRELRSRAERYEARLARLHGQRRQDAPGPCPSAFVDVGGAGDSGAARARAHQTRARPQLQRRRRRRPLENAPDLDDLLAQHPLFSRYVDKSRRKPAAAAGAEPLLDVRGAAATPSGEGGATTAAGAGPGPSVEELLGDLDDLQERITSVRAMLARARKAAAAPPSSPAVGGASVEGASPRHAGLKASERWSPSPSTPAWAPAATWGGGGSTPSPLAASPAGPPPLPGGAQPLSRLGSARRRASDFHIGNMVMSVNVGSKFVEQVRHEPIETPQWRLLADAAPEAEPAEGGAESSEENTDDEAYVARHDVMEGRERQRFAPPTSTRGGSAGKGSGKGGERLPGAGKGAGGRGKGGKGKGRSSGKARDTAGLNAGVAAEEDTAGGDPSPIYGVPQGKRRRRESTLRPGVAVGVGENAARPVAMVGGGGVGEARFSVAHVEEGAVEAIESKPPLLGSLPATSASPGDLEIVGNHPSASTRAIGQRVEDRQPAPALEQLDE